MSFFQRLYDVMPPSVVIASAVALGALVLLFGFNWLAARREDRDELARWEPVEVPVTDRRPAEPPDVEPSAAVHLARFVDADHEKAVAAHSAAVDAILHKPKRAPKRLNRHKAKVRRKK